MRLRSRSGLEGRCILMGLKIITGKTPGMLKIVLYGPEGIGKSTFASRFPRPLFIDTEGSTRHLDVSRTEKPVSWTMLLEQVKSVRDDPGVCATLVIDTADWAEQLCIGSICASKKLSGIEDLGYGKGYVYLAEEFGRLLNLLEEVVGRGVHVVLTAHAMMRKFEQPDELGAYDRWELKLQKKTAALVKEWADVLFFANYKTMAVAVDKAGTRHKAQGGKRVVYTSHHPCWDAKNCLGLPEELALDFDVAGPLLFPGAAKPSAGPAREDKLQSPPPPAGSPPAPASPPPAPPLANASAAAPACTAPDPAPASPPPSGTYAAMVSQTEGVYIPAKLRPLLENADVTEHEVRKVIDQRQKRFFPLGTSWETMEKAGFVDGWVLPNWDKIVQTIQDDPNRLPF